MIDDALARALDQESAAASAMQNGDPGPMTDFWAVTDDVTLFGAWGPIEKGHKAVTDTMRWVGSRFTSAATVDIEHTVIASSGDLAYSVGFERSLVSVDAGAPREMVIRVTHVYRRIDGGWKLVHRHADFPPPDQRKSPAG